MYKSIRKYILGILCIYGLLCSACGDNSIKKDEPAESELPQEQTVGSEETSIETVDESIAAEDVETETERSELSWTEGKETEGKLYQDLNLDGVGESDDEVYVSTIQYGDYEDKITAVRIHLGTGETLAQIYSVYGNASLITGKVFSEDRDAIILEIGDKTSNYGYATVYALIVSPADDDCPIPEAVTGLDTSNPSNLTDGTIFENSTMDNDVTIGTEVVDVLGMPLQGIRIYTVDENGKFQGLQRIFYWTGDGWTILQE